MAQKPIVLYFPLWHTSIPTNMVWFEISDPKDILHRSPPNLAFICLMIFRKIRSLSFWMVRLATNYEITGLSQLILFLRNE